MRRRQAKNSVCVKGKKEEVCFSPPSEDEEGDVLGSPPLKEKKGKR